MSNRVKQVGDLIVGMRVRVKTDATYAKMDSYNRITGMLGTIDYFDDINPLEEKTYVYVVMDKERGFYSLKNLDLNKTMQPRSWIVRVADLVPLTEPMSNSSLLDLATET
jgi:hypothetical protein